MRGLVAQSRRLAPAPRLDRSRRLGRAVPPTRSLWLRLWAASAGTAGADLSPDFSLSCQPCDAVAAGAAEGGLALWARPQPARYQCARSNGLAGSAGLAGVRGPRRQSGRCHPNRACAAAAGCAGRPASRSSCLDRSRTQGLAARRLPFGRAGLLAIGVRTRRLRAQCSPNRGRLDQQRGLLGVSGACEGRTTA